MAASDIEPIDPAAHWRGRRAEWKDRWRRLSAKQRRDIRRAIRRNQALADPALAEIASGFYVRSVTLIPPFAIPLLFTAQMIYDATQRSTTRVWVVNLSFAGMVWMLNIWIERAAKRGRATNLRRYVASRS